MIVGEAPGRKEVAAGRPFVGRAGKLLDSGLRTAGVDRAQVYITNVCKVLPETADGKIRAPSASEVEAWKPILEREIEATSPAAILALGRTAIGALTGNSAVPWGSRIGNVYCAYHPAFLLRLGAGGALHAWTMSDDNLDVLEDWHNTIREWADAIRA